MIAIFTIERSAGIQAITAPALQAYANKIGAVIIKITNKDEIYTLGKDYEWCFFIDGGILLNCKMLNMALKCPVDAVGMWLPFGAFSEFNLDVYFIGDIQRIEHRTYDPETGELLDSWITNEPRDIAFDTGIMCVPHACHEVWKPTELSADAALAAARTSSAIPNWNIARNVAKNRFKVFRFRSDERIAGAQDDLCCFKKPDSALPDDKYIGQLIKYQRENH